MIGLRVIAAGPGATLQDRGRHGWLRFGVTPAGPMDRLAFATANRAVGAAPDAPAIEVSLGGLDVAAEGAAFSVAVAGGSFRITLDGHELPPATRVELEPRARLSIRPGSAGSWTYLAVAGRFDVTPVLGSVATHTRSGLGGLQGRALAAGDFLPVCEPRCLRPSIARVATPWLDRPGNTISVMLGPQDDYFDADQIAVFLTADWTVSARSDRMAYGLEGPRLHHAKGFNIVSDGIAMGAIQVLGEGRPMVLMADRQPTGGYPKIATVIGPELGRLAQLRPGTRLRFAPVSVTQAVAARQAEAQALMAPLQLEALTRTEFSPEFLLGLNLIGGVSAGREIP